MNGEFDIFRENVRRKMKHTTQKSIESVSGICHSTISATLAGKREFREGHLEGIAKALNTPLSVLFQPPEEAEVQAKEAIFMQEIKECLELMIEIPEFKRAILARCDELKRTAFKDDVEKVKKKTPIPKFNFMKKAR